MANLTKPASPVRGYVVAGPGAYYRKVEITEYVGSGVICDPWYYVCGTYPVTAVVGSRGGWDFGFNVGGGVGFKIGESSEFFIETRYHYVAGPEIVSATTLPTSRRRIRRAAARTAATGRSRSDSASESACQSDVVQASGLPHAVRTCRSALTSWRKSSTR